MDLHHRGRQQTIVPSFWVEPADVGETEFVVRGAEAHHLVRVRRSRPGDEVTAVDGCGMFYRATVTEQGKDTVRCRIDERCPGRGECPVHLCLVPSLVKGQRLDLVIEKATELGVSTIRPLVAARGVVRSASGGRAQRWQRVARAAVKQCDRSCLPAIHPPAALSEVVDMLKAESYRMLLAAPAAPGPDLARLLAVGHAQRLALLIGPEGGFTAAEIDAVLAAGGEAFAWRDRVLRAETACVVLSALVLHEAERSLTT